MRVSYWTAGKIIRVWKIHGVGAISPLNHSVHAGLKIGNKIQDESQFSKCDIPVTGNVPQRIVRGDRSIKCRGNDRYRYSIPRWGERVDSMFHFYF